MAYKKTTSVGAALLIGLGLIFYNGIAAFSAQPEMHRGFVSQNVLSVVGHTYKVRYSCRQNKRAIRKSPTLSFFKGMMGSHFNEFLAWNDKDAIAFARKAFPRCGVTRLEEVLFRTRYINSRQRRKVRNGTRVVIG